MTDIKHPAVAEGRPRAIAIGLLLLLFLAAVAAGGIASIGLELGTRDVRWLDGRLLAALVTLVGLVCLGGGTLVLRAATAGRKRQAFLVILALGVFAVTVGVVTYRAKEVRAILFERQISRQADVVLLKSQIVERWLYDRSLSPNTLALSLGRLDHGVEALTASEKQIMSVLFTEYLAGNPERIGVSLYASSGDVAFHLGRQEKPSAEEVEAVRAFAASREARPRFAELRRADPTKGGLRLAYLRPVVQPLAPTKSAALLVVTFDPSTLLFRQLDEWPPDSHTSECLIVRRDDGRLTYVKTPPGVNSQSAGSSPMSGEWRASLEAVIAGHASEVRDYRDKTVLSASRGIKALPWYVVVKTDQAEILNPFEEDFRRSILMVAGFIAIGGALMAPLVWAVRRSG